MRIANYYAQVGVGIDRSSLASVRKYLSSVEQQMKSFQQRLTKSSTMTMRVRLDNRTVVGELRKTLQTFGRNYTLRINNLAISSTALSKSINNSLKNSSRPIQVSAVLSQSSIANIRSQLTSALSNVTLNPRINPRVSSAGGASTSSSASSSARTRSTNPMHNPMLVGGGVGAFLRYGPYALPFVAGTLGLNAMSQQTMMLEGQSMMLNTMSGDRELANEQRSFIDELGERLGIRSSTIVPSYAQVFAASRGTSLEAGIQEGFSQFMSYAAVTGLDDENMRGALRAISQMVGKGTIQAEELKGQLGDRMPSAVRLMAEAVADGDVRKLFKMMEQGELLSTEVLPKFFDVLGKEAEDFLGDYYKSVRYWQGQSQRNSEEWFRRFMDNGAISALASFYQTWSQIVSDTLPWASTLGNAFERVVHLFNAAMLAPAEMLDYFSGGKGNFMYALFGDINTNSLMSSFRELFSTISSSFSQMVGSMQGNLSALVTTLTFIGNVLGPIAKMLSETVSLLDAYQTGGMAGAAYETRRQNAESQARGQALIDAQRSGMPYTQKDLDDIARGYMMDWEIRNPRPEPQVQERGSRSLFGRSMIDGFSEYNEMVKGRGFSFGGLWDILNKDRSYNISPNAIPQNSAAISSQSGVTSHILYIKQDPLQVNAVVEARTDADAMEQAIQRFQNRVWSDSLSLTPIVIQ